MKKHTSDNKGFTLVELIVVLVILAIMAAIIVPIALSHIDEARKQQEIQDAQSFMKAIQTELSNSYKDFITGDADSEIFGTGLIFNNSTDDMDLRTSKFAQNVLNKTDIAKPYVLIFYTKGYNDTDANTDGIYGQLDVYSIVYWSTKDSFPLFYNFDNNSWDHGSLYTAKFMYRGSENANHKNIILDGHKHAGEKIKIYILSYAGNDVKKLNDEIALRMKDYKD